MAILHYYGLDESAKGIFRHLPTASQAESILEKEVPWTTLKQRECLVSVLEAYKTERITVKAIPEGFFRGETEIESTSSRKVRKQQRKLREILLKLYGNQCAICDIGDPTLLIASHIIPWNEDSENRLNPENVIILCVLHDKLFERGFIAFDDELNVLISSKLQQMQSNFLRMVCEIMIPFRKPSNHWPTATFLSYHRKNTFSR